MLNTSSGAPEFDRAAPAPECRAAVSLPQIQPSHPTSLRVAIACAIQAPPPTPGLLRLDNSKCLTEA
jgi:hypothetical protein